MTEALDFPAGFRWGVATAAHQVEGDNVHSDWWEWETDPQPKAPLNGPSGEACDHYRRYDEDIALIASLGLNTYRFSVEWARVEPRAGEFDEAVLQHYSDVVDSCLQHGVMPVVTLQHYTLPAWVSHAGSWLNPDLPAYFARYTRRVVAHFGDRVPYFCTINEPGNMLTRSYLGTFPTPPFQQSLDAFDRAAVGVNAAHCAAREVIKTSAPAARVGIAHALQNWHASGGGGPLMRWARELYEDRFFAEIADDDFIGIQTYTRLDVDAPAIAGPLLAGLLYSRRLTDAAILPVLRRRARALEFTDTSPADGVRRTQMGYLWAPTAVEVTTRRIAELFPGKELLITEHGVGTDDDDERIEYLREGLRAVRRMIVDGLPISGYIHWTLLDNWEWWDGYRPKYGLVAVDRATQARAEKPSARWYGEVALANRLPAEEAQAPRGRAPHIP